MRNLKKILALVLALVMSFSLLATANAFTDDKDIDATYDEAVTVLSNLKVFQGYENGSFQPKGDITRAEVAAIIYRIVTGDVNDAQVKIYSDYKKFDDVNSGSWYAGYVNFCANAEYVKGRDAKTFDPNGKVTGYEALAMILRAVGYDKNGEFTGSGWQVQTAAVGKKLGITDKVSAGTLGGTATREVVAEILFRSILVPQVEYTVAFGYQDKNMGIFGATNSSIGYETFKLEKTAGVVEAVGYHAGTTTLGSTVVTNTDANWENIGYAAYAYTVPTSAAKTRTAVSDVTVTGVSLGTSTNGTAYEALTNDANTNTDPDYHIASLDAERTYYYNGVPFYRYAKNTAGNVVGIVLNSTVLAQYEASKGKVGVKFDFVDNDNGGLAESVVVTDYTVAYVTAITNTSNTGTQGVQANSYYLNNVAVKADDLVCADELAYQDLVTYVAYDSIYYVTKAAYTQDTFSRITYQTVGGAKTSYVIGGETYIVSAKAVTPTTANTLVSDNLTKTLNVYTDPYGHIIYAAVASEAVNYLYVLANRHTDGITGLTDARVVNTDGSITDVQVAKYTVGTTNTKVFDVNDLVNRFGGMFGYTVNADGSYNLTPCSLLTSASYTTQTATVYGTTTNVGVNLTTVVVDLRGVTTNSTAATAVYTGYDEIPTFTSGTFHYVASGSWVRFAFLTAGVADLTNNFIVYKTATNYEEVGADLQHYYYLDVIVNGEKQLNYKLTATEYNLIKTYGVGEYNITKTGVLKSYTAFPEAWVANATVTPVTVSWASGGITFTDSEGTHFYAYGEIPFTVLNITDGTADPYTMVRGQDVRVYLHYNAAKTAVTEIYIIEGKLATTAAADGVTPNVFTENGKTYTVANNYVTTVSGATIDPTAYLLKAEVRGTTAQYTGKGDGLAPATAFELVATEESMNSVSGTLEVTAVNNSLTQTITIGHKGDTAPYTKGTGNGYAKDGVYTGTYNASNEWYFTITDGTTTVYFHVTVAAKDTDVTYTIKADNTVLAYTSTDTYTCNSSDNTLGALAALIVPNASTTKVNLPAGKTADDVLGDSDTLTLTLVAEDTHATQTVTIKGKNA